MNSIGKKMEKIIDAKIGVKWLDLSDDVLSSIKNLKRGTLSVNEWIRSYAGEKEHAIYTRNDPLPAFIKFVYYIFVDIPYFLKNTLKNHHN